MDIKELAKAEYLNGMKYKDISTKHSIPESTIKSWKSRGRWGRVQCKWSQDVVGNNNWIQRKLCVEPTPIIIQLMTYYLRLSSEADIAEYRAQELISSNANQEYVTIVNDFSGDEDD